MSGGSFLLNEKPGTRELYRRCAAVIALIGGVFCLTVMLLLAANYVHTRIAWPAEVPALTGMTEDLRARSAEPAARDQLRALDLLTRRTYFFSVEFQRRGFGILLGGALVTLLALWGRGALTLPLPQPGKPRLEDNDLQSAARARRVMAGLSLVLAGFAGVMVYRLNTPPADTAARAVVLLPAGDNLPPSRSALRRTGGKVELQTAQLGENAVRSTRFSVSSVPAKAMPVTAERAAAEPAIRIEGAWPCFRGPGGIGVASVTNAPLKWNGTTGENVLWKIPLPLPGFSSPIVWESRVLLSGGTRDRLAVLCYDAATGALLWETAVPSKLPAAEMPTISDETTYAAPTMAAEGDLVFALYGTGDMVALNLRGETVWARNLGAPASIYGYASSLIAQAGKVFVQYDCEEDQRLLALDAKTGATVWETAREVMPSWTSPIVVDEGGAKELIVCANPFVAGYDLATGAEKWRTEGLGGEPAPSPAYAGGMVYAASDFSLVMAIDTAFPKDIVWQSTENLPDVSSPVASEKRLYMASSAGILTCFERIEGAVLWTQEFDAGFYSSPVLVGQRVYLTDLKGRTFVFDDADAYAQQGVCELGEVCSSTPAFVSGRIFLRGKSHLFCVGTP